jgi:hypothetical protein
MPAGIFKLYLRAGTSIMVSTKGGKPDKVWFME